MRGLRHKRRDEENSLQQWAEELQRKAHVGRVDQEDSSSRDRTSTRAHVAAAAHDETLSFFVRATGEDEASMRQRLTQQEVGRVATCARFLENTHGGEATLRQQEEGSVGVLQQGATSSSDS